MTGFQGRQRKPTGRVGRKKFAIEALRLDLRACNDGVEARQGAQRGCHIRHRRFFLWVSLVSLLKKIR
jgi:hypothetical protein